MSLSVDSLAIALESAVTRARTLTFDNGRLDVPLALASHDMTISGAAQGALHELAKGFEELLKNDSRFLGSEVRMVRGFGGMAVGFYPHFVGPSLIRYALYKGSAQAAIDWLVKVLTTRSATGKLINVLRGVKVAHDVQLTDDIVLMPIENVPEGTQKTALLQEDQAPSLISATTLLEMMAPKAALVISTTIDPFTTDDQFLEGKSRSRSDEDTEERIRDVTLALALAGPKTPQFIYMWLVLDDPDLQMAGLLSGMSMGRALEILPRPLGAPDLDVDKATKVVRAFLDMQGTARRKVRLALERLVQARLRHNVGDCAVELCTAFETLLGDDDKNEMTHKVRVRLARLIGGPEDIRRKNRDAMRSTYDIRSKLLHSGSVDIKSLRSAGDEKMTVHEVTAYAAQMCADLITLIITRRAIPDWQIFDITEHPHA